MRGTLGLAASIAIVAGVVWVGVGLGPGATPLAWAGVCENIESSTAMHFHNEILILDAEGNEVQKPGGKTEFWTMKDGRSRMSSRTPKGELVSESITGIDERLHLHYPSKHAMLTGHRFYPPRELEGGRIDGADSSSPLEMLLRLTDERAQRVGEVELDGVAAIEFQIAMADLLALYMEESGVDKDEVKVDSPLGGDIETMLSLPPMRLWVSVESELPIRLDMPMPETAFGGMAEVPEGGRIVGRFDFLGWNEEVNPAVFETRVPKGWGLDRYDSVFLGQDHDPDSLEWVPAGLPLASGVTFELKDSEGNIVVNQNQVAAIAQLSHLTGYLAGGSDDEWDKVHIEIRFTEEVQGRIDTALGDADSAQWTFHFGEEFEGIVSVTRRHDDGSPQPTDVIPEGVVLGAFEVHGMSMDAFINTCLESQPASSLEGN